MFRSVAGNWWCTVEAMSIALIDDIVWELFKRVFVKKFILNHIWV